MTRRLRVTLCVRSGAPRTPRVTRASAPIVVDALGHGIAAPPAVELPEPWLSVLSHYRRRKPETALIGDDFAAVAA